MFVLPSFASLFVFDAAAFAFSLLALRQNILICASGYVPYVTLQPVSDHPAIPKSELSRRFSFVTASMYGSIPW